MVEISNEIFEKMEMLHMRLLAEGDRDPYLPLDCFIELASCESPIEFLLGWAIMCSEHNTGGLGAFLSRNDSGFGFESADRLFDLFCEDSGCGMLYGPHPKAIIMPQAILGRFRADFLIIARDFYGHVDYNGPKFAFVVECDGHEFHEKTKVQAAKDKSRDRWIATAGLPVLRFAGSEIWADAKVCADQVWDYIYAQIRRMDRNQ